MNREVSAAASLARKLMSGFAGFGRFRLFRDAGSRGGPPVCGVACARSLVLSPGFFPLFSSPGEIHGNEHQVDNHPDTEEYDRRIVLRAGLSRRRLCLRFKDFAHDC